MPEKTLIALATAWGPKHGGINSFNRDLLRAFGIAFHESVRVICVVPQSDAAAQKDACSASVELREMAILAQAERLEAVHAAEIVASLGDVITPETVWLGHDSFTGAAAVEAARKTNTHAAVIHHMSYGAYKGFQSGSSQQAEKKTREQRAIFSEARYRLAVGPLLRDELKDLLDSDDIRMLIPGLPEIKPKNSPSRWTVLQFGRLDPENDRIKQGRLGIAAFAHAYRDATVQPGLSPALRDRPRLKLYGIEAQEETELRQFAGEKAGAAIELHALPFMEDRNSLFEELSRASVALMPSWHEGFGLTGWEAIGAGIPLIMSKQSGLYRLLTEEMAGAGTTYAVTIMGREAIEPYQEQDVTTLASALKQVAADGDSARRSAIKLRELLSGYTWRNCAESLAETFNWEVKVGYLQEALKLQLAPPVPVSPISGLMFQPQPLWKAGRGISDSMLLRAEEASVPFHPEGESLLQELLDWAQGTEGYPLAIRLYTGPGGIGKTRLLIEACHRLNGNSWQTGFLESDLRSTDIKRLLPGWLNQHKSVFMAVDYSETRSEQIASLVEAAQLLPNHRLRIVLLARDAGDWWDRLANRNPICEAIFTGYATTGPYTVPPLHSEIASRQSAFRIAWLAFAERLGINAQEPPLPDLTADHFASPLYLQMAALMALRGEQADTSRGLLDALLRHEGHYWQRLSEGLGLQNVDRHALHLLALSTLSGGIATPREAWALYQSSGGPMLGRTDLERLFVALTPLYPGRQGLQPVRPDLLGESLVARALAMAGDQGIGLLSAVLGNQSNDFVRHHALTTLTRLAQHRPEMVTFLTNSLRQHFPALVPSIVAVSLETGEPLPTMAMVSLNQLSDSERRQVVGLLRQALPEKTVKLGAMAVKVFEYLVGYAHHRYERRKSPVHRKDYLQALNMLGTYQIALGRNQDAQQSYTSALRLVAEGTYDESAMDWEAGLKSNLSNVLAIQGGHEASLDSAQSAVLLFEALTKSKPKRFEPDLAVSLNNLGLRLSNLGRYDEGLQCAERALDIRERLSQSNPDKFEPALASSLNNLGGRLSELARFEEALQHARRALGIRERLAHSNPDHYEPDLAASLNSLGGELSEIGRYEESLQYAERALKIQERLALAHPDRYERDLAGSLSNTGSYLSSLGRFEEGLQYALRALGIRERLAQTYPDSYEPNLASSLSNVGGHLAELGRFEEALQHEKRALEIRERLASTIPACYESELVTSLDGLGSHLSELGRYEEGLEHTLRALGIQERLARAIPARYEPDLARLLNNIGSHLANLGRYQEALNSLDRALGFYESFSARFPKRYSVPLINAQNERALVVWVGGLQGTVAPTQDAFGILLSNVPVLLRPGLQASRDFTFACNTYQRSPSQCSDYMQKVECLYKTLPITQRRLLQLPHVIVSAYLASQLPTPERQQIAADSYQAYVTPRGGRAPQTLLDGLLLLECTQDWRS